MRAFASGVRVVEGVLGTRVCLLLVFIFVCSIDRSNTSDASTKSTFRPPGNLTDYQKNRVVTIEFDFKHINQTNRTAVNIAYAKVRRKILEYLNRRTSPTVPPTQTTTAPNTNATFAATTTPSTSTPTASVTTTSTTLTTTAAVTTATPTTTATTIATSTAPIPTTPTTTASVVETTTKTPTTDAATTSTTHAITTTPITTAQSTTSRSGPIEKKRKRRGLDSSCEYNVILTDDNLPSIDIEPEIDENGNLRMTFLLDIEGLDGCDLGKLLSEAVDELNKTESAKNESALEEAGGAAVVKIYRGLPPPPPPSPTVADFRVWLPILLVIVILLIVFIFVYCWKATNKKRKTNESKKTAPTLDSKPDSSNGHAPRILDDSYGWLVPYEQFGNA